MKSNLKLLNEKIEKLKRIEEKLGDEAWSDKYTAVMLDERLTEEEILDFLDEVREDISEAETMLKRKKDGDESGYGQQDFDDEEFVGERNYFNLNNFDE